MELWVSSSAIKMANDEVLKLAIGRSPGTSSVHSGKRSPNGYLMFTWTQRCEIGKWAAAHGVTASLEYYTGKYPRLRLTETGVRRFKNLYKEAVKKKIDEVTKLLVPMLEMVTLILSLIVKFTSYLAEKLVGLCCCGMNWMAKCKNISKRCAVMEQQWVVAWLLLLLKASLSI